MATAHASPSMSRLRCDDIVPSASPCGHNWLGEPWRSVLAVATAVATIIIAAVLAWRPHNATTQEA